MSVPIPVSGTVLEVPVSELLRNMIGEHLGQESYVPVAPRYAATVMLVRDVDPAPGQEPAGQQPVEVFMLRRAATMAFAPDAYVFPGGRVDEADDDPALPWAGPTPEQWAEWMKVDEPTARRVVVAAAREVFEETGILLVGPDSDTLLSDVDRAEWAADRELVSNNQLPFSELLQRRKLVLRTDLLGLRSNWLTPEFEPRRFDTFFFAALVPPGQDPDSETAEAADSLWVQPEEIIANSNAGKLLLLPPTAYNLAFLANARSAEDFVSERREVKCIKLAPTIKDDGETVLTVLLP
jgi:8-oxo-dGTP pyrophosphatase MutT (NUDIX family)